MHRLSANRAVKILWRPVVSLSQRQSVPESHASRSRLTPGFNANLTTKLNSAGVKVTVDLPEMMLRALSALARAEDVAVGQLVRDAITVLRRMGLQCVPHPRVLCVAHWIAAKSWAKHPTWAIHTAALSIIAAHHLGPAFPGHPYAHLFMMDAQESDVIST